MKTNIRLVILGIALLQLACAHTRITSRVNHDYSDREYNKILVIALFDDLGLQDATEERIRSRLAYHGVECVFEHELFFSGADYSDEEFWSALERDSVDAILEISPRSSGTRSVYIPSTSTTKTKGSGSVDGFGNIDYRSTSKTTTSGGYNVNKPWARFTAELYDVETGEKVWYATANTGGNAFAKWKTIVRSMAGKTVSKLAKDGLIP